MTSGSICHSGHSGQEVSEVCGALGHQSQAQPGSLLHLQCLNQGFTSTDLVPHVTAFPTTCNPDPGLQKFKIVFITISTPPPFRPDIWFNIPRISPFNPALDWTNPETADPSSCSFPKQGFIYEPQCLQGFTCSSHVPELPNPWDTSGLECLAPTWTHPQVTALPLELTLGFHPVQHRHSGGVLAICQPRHSSTAAARTFPGTAEKGDEQHSPAESSESRKQQPLTSTRLENRQEAAWQAQEPASWSLNSTNRYKFYPAPHSHICHCLKHFGAPKRTVMAQPQPAIKHHTAFAPVLLQMGKGWKTCKKK